jgi:hypothetical protein
LSSWKYALYALVCCLGSHTFKWLIRWSIYRPQLQNSRWTKAAVLCGTPDSPVVHRTAHYSLSGAPSRCSVRVGDRWRRRLFHTGQSSAHTGQSSGLLSECHLELAVGLVFHSPPDSPVRLAQTVRSSTLGLFLDLLNVFFWGVAFLNSLVQVHLASCELQTQTLENLLVHGLCCSSNTKTQLAKWLGVHFPYNLHLFGDWWQHNQNKQIIQVFEWKYAIYLLGCMIDPTTWNYGLKPPPNSIIHLLPILGPNNQNHLRNHL